MLLCSHAPPCEVVMLKLVGLSVVEHTGADESREWDDEVLHSVLVHLPPPSMKQRNLWHTW